MPMKWMEKRFKNLSDIEIRPAYGPDDIKDFDYQRDLGVPGVFPFTRGIYSTMYRGRLWTMRQFAGFGSAEESNRRYRYLLKQGNMGLSVAFDMPTLMGYDSDDPRSRGEVGRCGVAVDSVTDMEVLFRGIPLDNVSVSMTINGPAIVLFAMYLVVAERQGVKFRDLQGTLQNDILKEYIAQKEWICPPAPSLKMINDIIGFCVESAPRYHPLSVSGYHIREAGSTAAQELAFTLADGFAYVELGLQRGLSIDAFAKFRAARRIWARWLRDRYGAVDPAAQRLRFHTQTAGVSLTAQQPMNNVARTTVEALAAVLGGTQSLHTNALDEVLALPTEEAATLALRTQQVIAYETGVPDVVDPLGGSYYVEWLTDRIEELAESLFARIVELGDGSMLEGVLHGVESGWFVREIAEAAFQEQRRFEEGDLIQVGVNAFTGSDDEPLEVLEIPMATEHAQRGAIERTRTDRDAAVAGAALASLVDAARQPEADLMMPLIDCSPSRPPHSVVPARPQ